MQIAMWMVLVGIALVFLITSKLLLVRALFKTKALQWAKHQKTTIGAEALWVWRIAFVLVLAVGIGEYRKLGNPVLGTAFSNWAIAGLCVLALGLWAWLASMHARRQYAWFFQVLAPGEKLPPFSTTGVYATVRNPRELGLVLVLAGMALSLGLKFTLAFVALFLLATVYRASSRDRILIEKYGKQYIDYSRTGKLLIPYVW